VLLLFDVGGSMDNHLRTCEELFSAARTEFKHLEYYYFHNCVYETVWRENRRRQSRRLATWDLLHTYPSDYKLIMVGDAAMSPYEIAHPGGSVEHWNEESGEVWLRRLLRTYPHASWLNPLPRDRWRYFPSAGMINELFEDRMFPLTLDGLDAAMRAISH
ncbi:MAG: VWA domain-containing protein, partial [Alphaproteobacteria bacterium]|nr:VWA domain-containing protein [Alphaproteobacteria bacterium]